MLRGRCDEFEKLGHGSNSNSGRAASSESLAALDSDWTGQGAFLPHHDHDIGQHQPNRMSSTTPSRTDVAAKIAELQAELPTADRAGETRLRDVYTWATLHLNIASELLSKIPVDASIAPVVKLAIGIALLPAVASRVSSLAWHLTAPFLV